MKNSTPKAEAKKPEPPKICASCNFKFPEGASPRRDYRQRKDGTVVCRSAADCRARQLNVTLGHEVNPHKPAEWLWMRYPRDRVWQEVDVRPKDWRASGWLPRDTLRQRVRALILYCSWCYPVCMPYAVQIAHLCPLAGRHDEDPDEILLDRYRQPMPLRVKDIARILNEHYKAEEDAYVKRSGAPNVSRALRQLQLAGEVRVDEDGVLAPAPMLAELSIADRQGLYGQRLAEADAELRGVPRRFRRRLELVLAECPEHISTDIFGEVKKLCSAFNDRLRDLRTDRDGNIEQQCTRGLILIPDWEKRLRSSSAPASPAAPVASESRLDPSHDDGEGERKELYAAGAGKGALNKLPAKADRFQALVSGYADAALGKPVEPSAIRQLILACRRAAPGVTAAEIGAALADKAAVLRKADNPPGLMMVAVPRALEGEGVQHYRKQAQAQERQAAVERSRESERQAMRLLAEEKWKLLTPAQQLKWVTPARAVISELPQTTVGMSAEDRERYVRDTALDAYERDVRQELEAERVASEKAAAAEGDQ